MYQPDPRALASVFGSPFGEFLNEPILIVGKDRFTRLELADMGITQLRAARIVSSLAKDLKVKSIQEFYQKVGPASLANTLGVGLHSVFVLWRAFEAKQLDPTEWYARGREGAIVTFLSVKAQEHRRLMREKKARPRRAQVALDDAKREKRTRSNGA